MNFKGLIMNICTGGNYIQIPENVKKMTVAPLISERSYIEPIDITRLRQFVNDVINVNRSVKILEIGANPGFLQRVQRAKKQLQSASNETWEFNTQYSPQTIIDNIQKHVWYSRAALSFLSLQDNVECCMVDIDGKFPEGEYGSWPFVEGDILSKDTNDKIVEIFKGEKPDIVRLSNIAIDNLGRFQNDVRGKKSQNINEDDLHEHITRTAYDFVRDKGYLWIYNPKEQRGDIYLPKILQEKEMQFYFPKHDIFGPTRIYQKE